MKSTGIAPGLVQVCLAFLRGRPFSFRILTSTSASHLLALYIWTPLIICFMTMNGMLTPAISHGPSESILLARAISNAEALNGSGNICRRSEVLTGAPGLMKPPLDSSTLLIRWGDSQGDEKARRYRPMKKSSLSAQRVNKTVYASHLLA